MAMQTNLAHTRELGHFNVVATLQSVLAPQMQTAPKGRLHFKN